MQPGTTNEIIYSCAKPQEGNSMFEHDSSTHPSDSDQFWFREIAQADAGDAGILWQDKQDMGVCWMGKSQYHFEL